MNLLSYTLGRGITAFSTRRATGSALLREDAVPGTGQQAGPAAEAYRGFNITHYCGDIPGHVADCRSVLCRHLGIPDECLVLPRQTHTDNVFVLDAHYYETFPQLRFRMLEDQDAIVTRLPGVCIGVSTADCVPLLMADSTAHVIAAVHAGWRGAVKRIAAKTLNVMTSQGADPARVQVAIGPSIARESFEVGEEVVDAFLDAGFHPCILSRQYPRPHIDLWQACVMQLEECGVPATHIHCSGIDTYQHCDSFFSARRLSVHSGRIFSGIMMTD